MLHICNNHTIKVGTDLAYAITIPLGGRVLDGVINSDYVLKNTKENDSSNT